MGGAKNNGGKKPLTSEEKRERARVRRAERMAQLREREEVWKAQVADHFGFLETTYGFHFANVDGSSWWQTTVRYDSPLLAVRIDNSVEFERVEVWLIRLVDGQLPEYPIFINPDTPFNYVILDRALQVRAPQEAEGLLELKGLEDEQVERSLVFLADALRVYCDDVLRGDFAIFDIIAVQIHQEVQEHPQEVRIILPDTAASGEEAPLAMELQKNYPQQPIRVEYYSTQRGKRRPRKSVSNGQP
ncbi:MAG TPA: hypothetical protein VFS83_07575 [Ktedonobacterales bacterium]|nr:hypothetical protein [Ktedonobacterales bacterium]